MGVGEDSETRRIDEAQTLVDPGAAPRLPVGATPGDTVGRYMLLEELGAGGMGVVHRAHDPKLGRDVALKLLLPRHIGGSLGSDGTSRFVREARAMAQLTHPNVVAVYDVGRHDGSVYIAMELLRGGTLRTWLRKAKARPWQSVLPVVVAAGEGLAAAHARGLIHRDFKPANVLMDERGRVKVADFGLARVATSTDATSSRASRRATLIPTDGPPTQTGDGDLAEDLTATGVVVGTPRYMAPEQHHGEELTPAVDQFAFCAVLYEALYGIPAIAGDTRLELHENAVQGRITPPPSERDVPRWLHGVVMRGLAPHPEDRHRDMDSLLRALRRGGRARRRWGAGAVAGLGALGVAALLVGGGGEDCDLAAADEAWNDAARDAVSAALTRSGQGHAEHTAARVTESLDDYATELRGAHAQVCRGRDQESDDAQARDARLACLDQRAAELGALATALARADAELVTGAVASTRGLPTIDSCFDAAPLPGDPRQRRDRLAAGRDVARARVALRAGQVERAIIEAEHARERLAAYPPDLISVEATYLIGRAFEDQHRLPPAERELSRAYWDAIEAKADVIALRAASAMVGLLADHPTRFDDAQTWVRHAEAIVARGGGTLAEQADLLSRHAGLLRARGELDEAIALRRRAVEAALEDGGPQSLEVATLRANLGNDLRAAGDLEAAAQLHRQALQRREQVLGPNHPDVATSLVGLAILDAIRGRPSDAEARLRRALAIREATVGPESTALGGVLANLANALGAQGKHDDALALYDRLVEIQTAAVGPAHASVATTLANSSNSLRAVGREAEAEARLRKALEIDRTVLGEDHPTVALFELTLVTQLHPRGRNREALSLVEHAAPILEAHHGPAHPYCATAQSLRGRVLAALARPEEARVELEAALTRMLEVEGDPEARSMTRLALAKVLWDTPKERARATSLARAAADDLAQAEGIDDRHAQELAAWRAAHDPSATRPG